MHVQSRAPGAGMHVHTERLALNTFMPADYKRSRWNVAADLTFVLSQPRLSGKPLENKPAHLVRQYSARVAFVLRIHACHQVRYHNMSYDSKSLLSILLAPEHDNHQVHDELVVTTHRAVLLS